MTENILIWAGIAVVAIIVEGCIVQLVSMWFAVGALASAVVSVFTDDILIQLAVFSVLSIICIVSTRPLARKLKKNNKEVPTNCDRYIGKTAEVIVDIDNNSASGQVKVDGSVWSAKSVTNEIIPVGTKVQVNAIEGVKMLVTPLMVMSTT